MFKDVSTDCWSLRNNGWDKEKMKIKRTELVALMTARDVLQKQIDERVALRRQEMLLADSFYRERKTRVILI